VAVRYQKIVEQDLDLGYGEVTDITNPAGGTMIGNKIGLHTFTDIFTLKDYGAAGSGSVDDSEALVKATTDQGYIVITPGTYSVGQDTEIVNCVLSFEGGIISVASGKTLTLGAGLRIKSARAQIFAGDGSVVFGADAPAETIYPEWWGVTNDGDDTTDSLLAMRTSLRGYDGHKRVVFAAGNYNFTNNKWVKGINNMHLIAYGAVFENDYTGDYDKDRKQTLFWEDYFQETGDSQGALGPYVYGSLIDTTSAFDSSVTLKTTSEASGYSEDDWILVFGYDNQLTGYPPNARYFEIAQIDSVDTDTGVITLKHELRNVYRDDWYEDATNEFTNGRARIKNLTRSDFQLLDTMTLEGVEIAVNPNYAESGSNGGVSPCGFRSFKALNCKFASSAPTMIDRIYYENCTFKGVVEPDKLIDRAEFRNCIFYNDVIQATGVNNLVFDGCTMMQEGATTRLDFQSRNVVLKDTNIYGYYNSSGSHSMVRFGAAWGMNSVLMQNVTLHNNDSALKYYLSDAVKQTLTVSTVVDANTITIDTADAVITRSLLEGAVIRGGYDNSYNRGTVTAIYQYDASHIAIEVDHFNTTPSPADTFTFSSIQKMELDGVHRRGLYPAKPLFPLTTPTGSPVGVEFFAKPNTDSTVISSDGWILSGDTLNSFGNVKGIITRIIVNVQRAYSGSDVVAWLHISDQTYGGAIASIDLLTTGMREITTWGANVQSSDTCVALGNEFVSTVLLRICNASLASALTYTTDDELPIVAIYIEACRLF
jgi:hypothetical protein